jgi:hypothetical protein
MYKYLILIFTLYSLDALAQKTGFPSDYPFVVVDRFCNCPEMEWQGNLGFRLRDIHESKNDTEIRFSMLGDRALVEEVITINHGEYNAYLYSKTITANRRYPDSIKKYGKWEVFPYRKFHIQQKDLKSIYSKLLTYHIDNLPNQGDIDKKGFYKSYVVEYKINNKFTTYSFASKKELDRYPDVQVFKDYIGIIATFDELGFDYWRNARNLSFYYDHF